jgi:kexin
MDEEMTGSANYAPGNAIPQKPKPTDLLPGDHGEAAPPGAQPTGEADAEPAGGGSASEGVFDGIDALRKHSAWLAGAFLIVLLAALAGGGYFLYRSRKRAAALGLAGDNGARGAYAPVSEDVPMTLFGRRKPRAEESKELYDAFGDGPSDDEDDETTALRYHDRFLEDDEPEASGSGSRERAGDEYAGSRDEPPAYFDADEEEAEGKGKGKSPARSGSTSPAVVSPVIGASNTSSSSWQDAADDRP